MKTRSKPVESLESLRSRNAELRTRVLELEGEVSALSAEVAGDLPRATAWLQTKVWRQRIALDVLNHKNATLRFRLRTTEHLGRGLTRDEYLKARAEIGNEQLRSRIDEDPE